MANHTIFISAGEASGDFLGANLAETLRKQNPTINLVGMGGNQMQKSGVSIVFDAEKLSVMGFVEVLKKLPSILWTHYKIKSYLKKTRPNAIVCIDLPDTHFCFFKLAKKLGIPVFYYVSPQIWAWRYSRIEKIRRYVRHIGVLFEFEEKLYQRGNIPVTFVGHPLAAKAKPSMTKEAAFTFFNLDPTKQTVSLFPGSRHSELKNHLPLIIESAEKIREKMPDTQFVLMLAPHFDPHHLQIPAHIKTVQTHLYDLLNISDGAIAVSGTITLEIGLMRVPLCVIYRTNALSMRLGQRLIKTSYIALCNIVTNKPIAKELIQEAATPEAISTEILQLLSDSHYHSEKKALLSTIRAKIENKMGVDTFAKQILQRSTD